MERFFRSISKFDFIINSPEFKIFSRPNGQNIEKTLEKLPKLSISQTYERIKEATQVNEEEYDASSTEQYANKITEFNFFMKKTKPFLQQLKIDLAIYLTNKADCLQAYRGLHKVCDFYEDLNLSHYTNNNSSKLVFNNPDNQNIKESMNHVNSNLRNAFVDIYHWVQGELFDL